MTFAIYQIQESPVSVPFYDISFNDLVGSIEDPQTIEDVITALEDYPTVNFYQLIFSAFVPVQDYHCNAYSCTLVCEFEFLNTDDLQSNLRNRIQDNYPELLI